MRTTTLSSVLFLSLIVGCGGMDGAESMAETGPPAFRATPGDAVAVLDGDVGELRDVDRPAAMSRTAFDLEGRRLDYVELNAHWGEGSWAMLGLDFLGGVHHDSFAPGETLRFDNEGWQMDIDEQPKGLFVAAVGCSDPDLRDAESMFDETASSVDVTMLPGEEEDVLHVSARFADGNTLSGTFPLAR
jgi:hypothetical protein